MKFGIPIMREHARFIEARGPDGKLIAEDIRAMCDELARLQALVSENHDWQCGCGHWNGPNLRTCSACDRTPTERN